MFENLIPYWARVRPDAPALVLPSGSISFRQFEDTIQVVANALADWPLPPGSKVAISDSRPLMHWSAIFALDRLGHLSISDDRSASAAAIPSIAGVIAETAERAAQFKNGLVTDRDWLDRASRLPRRQLLSERHQASDRVRILLSSGTTGRPKECLFTREVIDIRATRRAGGRPHFESRFATAMGLGTTGGFFPAVGSWTSGGAVVYGSVSLAETLVSLRPNHVLVSPLQLQQLLHDLPGDFAPRADLTVMIGGSATPPRLAAEARSRLTSDVRLLYASTEGGSVTSIDAADPIAALGAVGFLAPWAQLEIVDTSGRRMPRGEVGIIRIAGDEVISAYDDEPDHPSLHDGWFYPGDVGRIRDDGMVFILGRSDDVLNMGGVKVSALDLERQILEVPGVSDVAVVGLRTSGLETHILAAVVTERSGDVEDVRAEIARRLGQHIRVVSLSALPRNDMGKVVRRELELALIAAGVVASPV